MKKLSQCLHSPRWFHITHYQEIPVLNHSKYQFSTKLLSQRKYQYPCRINSNVREYSRYKQSDLPPAFGGKPKQSKAQTIAGLVVIVGIVIFLGTSDPRKEPWEEYDLDDEYRNVSCSELLKRMETDKAKRDAVSMFNLARMLDIYDHDCQASKDWYQRSSQKTCRKSDINLAVLIAKMGDYTSAKKRLTELLMDAEKDEIPMLENNLGYTQILSGEISDGVRHLMNAANGNSKKANMNLGYFYLYGLHGLSKSLVRAKEKFSNNDDLSSMIGLALVLEQEGDWQAAWKIHREVASLTSTNPWNIFTNQLLLLKKSFRMLIGRAPQ